MHWRWYWMEHAKALRAYDPNTMRISMGRIFATLKETSFASVVTTRNSSRSSPRLPQPLRKLSWDEIKCALLAGSGLSGAAANGQKQPFDETRLMPKTACRIPSISFRETKTHWLAIGAQQLQSFSA